MEFKAGQALKTGDEVLTIWAKCLSCFANTDGGVLIFGIDAPRGVAKNLSLVQDLAKLNERLKSLLPRVTEPPVQNVEIVDYADPPGSNQGFVVCHIPASPWRPHQVKLDGQPNQFYIRAADNCIPCGVAILRSLFAPEFVSSFEVIYRIHSAPRGDYSELKLHCWIKNLGPSTASDVFALCSGPTQGVRNPQFDRRLWNDTSSGSPGFAVVANRPIHPEETVKWFGMGVGMLDKTGSRVLHVNMDPLTLDLSISARNQLPLEFTLTIRKSDLENSSNKNAIPIVKGIKP